MLIGVETNTRMTSFSAVATGTQELSTLLRHLWGLPQSHVTVLDSRASAEDVLGAVRDAAQAARDTLLVYFAGHGIRDFAGEKFYLCLAAADPDCPQIGTVAYRDLRDVVRRAGVTARYRLTVLDCCFSGMAGTMGPPGVATRIQLAKALDEVPSPTSEPVEDYGDVVFTSAPHDRESFVLPGAVYPETTGELLGILAHGVPGLGAELSVHELWQRVRKQLVSRGSPEPQLFAQNTAAHHLGFPNRAAGATVADLPHTVIPGTSVPGAGGTRGDTGSDLVRAGTGQARNGTESMSSARPAPADAHDWQPAPVGRWRPEDQPPYPQEGSDDLFHQQRERRELMKRASADLKRKFRMVRRRLYVPPHVRSPTSVATWLHRSTGDPRWTVIADSVKALSLNLQPYSPGGSVDPYAATAGISSRPTYVLTMATVDAYRARVEQLRADIDKLTGLHSEPPE
ncbi:hypothetical protein AN216_10505 [Streptomyces oceani]|uniref:Peptidase C14 caspase domain-containing protein n=1 Tax=Streptomyces oceani TaxID=1075402 RepID=A0A1E7KIK3_9ACTN|nr:caspase family protein [Streptomyces oceani]OEV03674.1 hypothetical protein AN216_10505 [Streptomyces oceani]